MKRGFSLIMAIIFLVLVATIGMFSLNTSAVTAKQTTDIFLREQAELLAQSATELAILDLLETDFIKDCKAGKEIISSFFPKDLNNISLATKTLFFLSYLPITTIIFGCLLGKFFAPYISAIITKIGVIVNKTTELRPILMGLTLSVIMGIILTLPISSAAIGISLGLSGLAAGAALTGCCCQMIGFAIMSYDDNDLGTVFSIGFGTSMIQIPNIIKNPIIWIPPIVSSAILGVLSTTVFKLFSNSIASGMGTSGLVGQIASFSVNGMSYLPTMIILHFLLPAILTFIIYKILKKKGYIKVGDLKI